MTRDKTDNIIATSRAEPSRVRVIAQMEGYEVANRVYDRQGIAPTICTCQGGNRQPKIIRYVKRI